MLDVPTMPAAETLAVPDVPVPPAPMHVTDVIVVQLLVEQSAMASTAVTVASVEAKFAPVSVAMTIVVATLYAFDDVTSGAMVKRSSWIMAETVSTLSAFPWESDATIKAKHRAGGACYSRDQEPSRANHAGCERGDNMARYRCPGYPAAG